ncbi:hypothetical protein, partial [Mycobacteroides abscessus]|uniref:hypothetical protein n=1 Tax=Mycobacteroides abscessus TaxID=36809 RepID=UPI001A96898F
MPNIAACRRQLKYQEEFVIVLVLGAGAQKLQLLGLISRITPGRVSSNQPTCLTEFERVAGGGASPTLSAWPR